ncbi:hypothetical protein HU200_016209 [Digitaria exilis]|uniref:Uncharacterized protein n=1 Tax=Digitaria exilis TaxID=1010633 RepID=A0A835F9K3_9POAL|nr:hypothetical protein HU200_016209 [Digitaria exilis]
MIEPDPVGYDGKAKAYVISRLMLQLIRSESVKENFVTILEDRNPLSALPRRTRLSIVALTQDHDIQFFRKKEYPDYIPTSMAKPCIHSLYIFCSAGKNLTFKDLVFVRVLDLEGCKDLTNQNVEEIARLRNLSSKPFADRPTPPLLAWSAVQTWRALRPVSSVQAAGAASSNLLSDSDKAEAETAPPQSSICSGSNGGAWDPGEIQRREPEIHSLLPASASPSSICS